MAKDTIARKVIFVTGMSGTGKSTALAELARKGHRVVETDEEDWSENPDGSGWYWRENRIADLLCRHEAGWLFIAGTVTNQGKFYPQFDAVVLFSAPLELILERVARRNTNPYGKTAAERQEIIANYTEVEPLLRAGADHEIDTTRPVDRIVAELEQIAQYTRNNRQCKLP